MPSNYTDYENNLAFAPKLIEYKTSIFWHETEKELPKQRAIFIGINKKTGKEIISKIDDECLVIWQGEVKRSRYLTEQKRWEGHLEDETPKYWVKIRELEV